MGARMHREESISYFLLDSEQHLQWRQKVGGMERGRHRDMCRVPLGSSSSFGPTALLVYAALHAVLIDLLWFILLFLYGFFIIYLSFKSVHDFRPPPPMFFF